MHNTPTHANDYLCQIWKESIQNCIDTLESTQGITDGCTSGGTDGQTERLNPIYLTNFIAGGIIIFSVGASTHCDLYKSIDIF